MGGKFVRDVPTRWLIADTCDRQIAKRCTYTLVAYTCGGQIGKGRIYMLVAYTCGGQIGKGRTYTLVAYTCGGQIGKGRTYIRAGHMQRKLVPPIFCHKIVSKSLPRSFGS